MGKNVGKCIYGENLTVDEQLLVFRGRYPFRMYIPIKPTKYGIKIIFINDEDSKNLQGAIRPVRGLQQLSKLGSFSITKRSLSTVYYCNKIFIAHTLFFNYKNPLYVIVHLYKNLYKYININININKYKILGLLKLTHITLRPLCYSYGVVLGS